MPHTERSGEQQQNPVDLARERFITVLHGEAYDPEALRKSTSDLQDALMGESDIQPVEVFRELASTAERVSDLARVKNDETTAAHYTGAKTLFTAAAAALENKASEAPQPTQTGKLPSMTAPKPPGA